MAAAETCASLFASDSACIAAPEADVLPTQEITTQLRAKLPQACHTRDSRPSSKHSSNRENRLAASTGDLLAANERSSPARRSNSLSSAWNAGTSATAVTQDDHRVLGKGIIFVRLVGTRDYRLRMPT